jgi:hypothetical protein
MTKQNSWLGSTQTTAVGKAKPGVKDDGLKPAEMGLSCGLVPESGCVVVVKGKLRIFPIQNQSL